MAAADFLVAKRVFRAEGGESLSLRYILRGAYDFPSAHFVSSHRAMSMGLNLACEDAEGRREPREPRLERASAVMTGGTALALWIRYLGTLYPDKKTKGSPKEFELAESVADWDFHPTRSTNPSHFFGDATCKLVVDDGQSKRKGIVEDEYGYVTQKNRVRHLEGNEEKEYDVNGVVLRDIVAELFPGECTTDPIEGCALVDYGYLPPHKTDFEGPIIEKLGLANDYTFPLPPSIGNVDARHPARDVVSLLHPEVVIVTHLQALSMDNFLKVSREKTKRRAVRVKCFYELYDWSGFKIDGREVTVRGNVIDAMGRFAESPFCEVVLGDDEEAIEKLYTDTENVLKRFNGKTSFAPYGL